MTSLALRKKAKLHHPDTEAGNEEKFKKLHEAKEILLHVAERQEFKATLKLPDVAKKLAEEIA